MDIAQLGIQVRTDGVVAATRQMDGMDKAAVRAESSTDRLSRSAARAGQIMARMAAIGGTALAAMTANSIRLAVAAEETASKFQVVFRGSVERVDKAIHELSRTIPLTVTEMRGLTAGIQDMLVPMGVARTEAADLSVGFLELAGDIAAFSNTETDVVLQNIQSALAGSSEPMRKFGIDTREAALEAIALKNGLIEAGEEMTTAARAQAVFLAVQKDSADAAGYAAAELDSVAGKLRQLSRDFRQAQEDLGTALMPAFNEFLSILTDVNDDGLTPMQSLLKSVSVSIIDGAIAVLELRVAWLNFKDEFDGILQFFDDLKTKNDEFTESLSNFGANVRIALAEASGLDEIGRLFGVDLKQQGGGLLGASAIQDELFDPEAAAAIDAMVQGLEDTATGAADAKAAIAQMKQNRADIINGVVKPLEEASEAASEAADSAATFAESLEEIAVIGRRIDGSGAVQDYINGIVESMQAEIDALNGGKEAWAAYTREQEIASVTTRALQQLQSAGVKVTDEQTEAVRSQAEALVDARDAFSEMADASLTVAGAMESIGSAFGDVIRQIQLGVERGSDEYKKLEVAANAANVIAAIGAVLNQAQGDPYTAFARMAAMAAAVASLGYSVGNLSSSYTDPTEGRQATQGTGSVLGDTAAKTESIARSIEITAEATSSLVGINRGMLRQLENLNSAITGATTMLARDAGNLDFGAMPATGGLLPDWHYDLLFGPLGDAIGGFMNSIFGGKVSVADTGIRIEGGSLNDLLEGALVSAFQDLAIKKHILDDTDISRRLIELGDDVQAQFGDIFAGIVGTVVEAGLAIGWSMEAIQTRLDQFQVYAQDISFEDMDAEEQQRELQAFFGKIFDDLAGFTIPGIAHLQKLGEGMGETLVRVATSVQVFDVALAQLGFKFIQFGEQFPWWTMDDFIYRTTIWKTELVEMVGGIDAFISGFQAFFEAFASEEQKLSYITESLTARFGELGLTLPDTRDGVWDLMQSFDASTEAGREAIAMLLELAPVIDQFYKMQDEAAREAAAAMQQNLDLIRGFVGGGLPGEMLALQKRFVDAMNAADALGASTAEYAMIVRKFDRDMSVLIAQWTRNIILLSQDLFSEDETQATLDRVDSVRKVTNSLFTEWERALADLKGYADGLLLDEQLTTLTPAQQLNEAQNQYREILRRARGGDVEAAGDLSRAAQAYLEEARFMFASGAQYDKIFREVQRSLRGVEMPKGIEEYTVEIARNTERTANAVEAMQNETLMEIERYLQAMDLATSLNQLSNALGEPVEQLAERLGIPLDRLQDILGTDIDALTAQAFREVDLLSSIDDRLAEIRDLMAGNASANARQPKEDFGTYPGRPPDARLDSTPGITSDQADQIVVLLSDIRDDTADGRKAAKEGNDRIADGLGLIAARAS